MNQRERNALDRYITGNYGEDQIKSEPCGDGYCRRDATDSCVLCGVEYCDAHMLTHICSAPKASV